MSVAGSEFSACIRFRSGRSIDGFYRTISFQDVAKAGLKFGDEGASPPGFDCVWLSDVTSFADTDPEEEKAEQAALTEKFEPLIDWLRKEVREKGAARDGKCLTY